MSKAFRWSWLSANGFSLKNTRYQNCVKQLPLLSPLGPLKIVHSSIVPYGSKTRRTSSSVICLFNMPINNFRSSIYNYDIIFKIIIKKTISKKKTGQQQKWFNKICNGLALLSFKFKLKWCMLVYAAVNLLLLLYEITFIFKERHIFIQDCARRHRQVINYDTDFVYILIYVKGCSIFLFKQ